MIPLASSSDLYCQYVMVVSGPPRLPGIQMRLPQYRVICDSVEFCSHLSANSRVVKCGESRSEGSRSKKSPLSVLISQHNHSDNLNGNQFPAEMSSDITSRQSALMYYCNVMSLDLLSVDFLNKALPASYESRVLPMSLLK